MRVLLTGAFGFIGGHIRSRLLAAGHTVLATSRRPINAPGVEVRRLDFRDATRPADWLPLLTDVDAVINCAGLLQGPDLWLVHRDAPCALLDACVQQGVRRVIQISAVSADAAADTDYARSKLAADDHLRTLDLDWVVLRPSLVIADGSYGGSSTLRGLAGLPLPVIPLVGKAESAFQPLHADDLAAGVNWLLAHPEVRQVTLEPAGPQRLTVAELVRTYRSWLGLKPARTWLLPRGIQRLIARLGDLLGAGAMNSTSLRQLEYGNTTDSDWTQTVRIDCRPLDQILAARPAQVQDRWHARLYFLKPAIRLSLFALWALSALAGALMPAATVAAWVGSAWAEPARCSAVAFDAAMAAWLLSGVALRRCYAAQFWAILAYTVLFTVIAPVLWLAPLGELLKNLPILALAAVGWAIAEER